MPGHTVVVLHAHPDDESLLDAGTVARLVDAGHRVVLVFATSGDLGDVGDGVLAGDEALADRRRAEARASGAALGAAEVRFLDYRDSGHAPDADGRWADGSWCAAPLEDAVDALVGILRELDAALLVADDRHGGYGHPDHVRVHEVAWAASRRTPTPLALATIDREFLAGGVELARGLGLEVPEGFVPDDLTTWYTPHDELTHTVDVSAVLDRRRASMAAHATQSTGAPDTVRTLAVFLALPEEIFALAFSTEWFVAIDPLPADLLDIFTPVAP